MERYIINRYIPAQNLSSFYKRPLLPILLSLTFGLVTGYNLHFKINLYCATFFAVVSLGSIIHSIIKKEGGLLSPHILFYTLGIIMIYPYMDIPARSKTHLSYYCDKGKYEITGDVLESSKKNGGTSLIAENITVNGLKVKGYLRITIIGGIKSISPGDKIKFRSKIKSIRNFSNPNNFNYKRFLQFRYIYGRSYTNPSKIQITPSKKELLDIIRDNIRTIIENSNGDNDSKSILRALIAGDKQIPKDLRDKFNRTGTGHILAVSGLHMGIIASFIFIVVRFILSYIKPLLWSGKLKSFSSIFIIPGVIFFGLISGMSPSTQRAILMVICFVTALLIKKELDLLNTVTIAALIILIVFPPALFSISFQFSFSAVVFIILFLQIDHGRAIKRDLLNRAISFLYITIFATLGTTPLVMFYFHQTSLIGLFANIIVVPIFSFIVIPMGLIVIIFSAINNYLALFVVETTLYFIKCAISVIGFLSKIDLSSITTFKPSFFEILLYYAIFYTLFRIFKSRSLKKHFFLTIVLLILAFANTVYWIDQRYFRGDLKITFLDVGQGNASLIELPGGKTVLIDGGGYSNNRYFDMGKIVIAPFLLSKKILTIDTLILSHANSDHMNGLIHIAKNFNVKRLWSNGESSDTMSWFDLIETVKTKNIKHEIYRSYQSSYMDGVLFEVLYPGKSFKDSKERWRDSNNNSLVIKVTYGKTATLFPGDIEHHAEKELVDMSNSRLKSQIMLVPHHGSRTSSSDFFLNCVMPEIAVISSGYKNRYGFPHGKTLKRLKDKDIRIIRVDQKGSVIVDINRDEYRYRFCNNN